MTNPCQSMMSETSPAVTRSPSRLRRLPLLLLLAALALPSSACGDDGGGGSTGTWQIVHENLPGALLSLWGTSSTNIYAVGGDARDGTGPLLIHFDGSSWERIVTSETVGSLWWIYGFENGPIFMGGEGGLILRYDTDGSFTKMTTPGTGTVFGMWGATPDDMWAVGGVSDQNGGFVWRIDGDSWVEEPSLPTDIPTSAAVWKVNGRSANDIMFVGSNGVSLHWDGSTLSPEETGVATSLFTVHSNSDLYVAVGGLASGFIMEYDGSSWNDATPDSAPPGLTGVFIDATGHGYSVGQFGAIYERSTDGVWSEVVPDISINQGLHGAFIDPDGGFWTVGGQAFSTPTTDGLMLHFGTDVATEGLSF